MYYVVFGLLYVISLLPLPVLYLLSDFAFFIVYHLLGYRKNVVNDNLLHAFPERTAEERKQIAKKFYRNFCDNWIETIKLISVSKESFRRRLSGDNSIFSELHATGKAIQGNYGHFFNWEILNLYTGVSQPYKVVGIYFPQKSAIMNRLMLHIRAKWDNVMISLPDMARGIIPWRKKQYLIALIGDQSPAQPAASYWLNFMNRPTCFVKGPEKYAKGQNLSVTITVTKKIKRGYYHFDSFLLAENTASLPEGELMRRYIKHLENNIRLQPELYLWSHRRWKHEWKPEYADLWVDDAPLPQQ